MKVTYDTKQVVEGNNDPVVHISHNNEHIGTVFGTVTPGDGDFEKRHNIVYIKDNGNIIAILWDAIEEQPVS